MKLREMLKENGALESFVNWALRGKRHRQAYRRDGCSVCEIFLVQRWIHRSRSSPGRYAGSRLSLGRMV